MVAGYWPGAAFGFAEVERVFGVDNDEAGMIVELGREVER